MLYYPIQANTSLKEIKVDFHSQPNTLSENDIY